MGKSCVSELGTVSVPGVYAGFIQGFMFGDVFDKGLTFKMGETHVYAYLAELLRLLETGELNPEEIVTHHLPLEDATQGYKIFEKRQEDCRKIILIPGLKSQSIPPSEREILNAK